MVSHRRSRRSLRFLAFTALAIGAGWASCFRLNLSASSPAGVYFLIPIQLSRPLERGDLVLACPPPSVTKIGRARGYLHFGLCPGFLPELLKPVAALPGDLVAVQKSFVVVNRQPVPGALLLVRDSHGRALTPFSPVELEVPADSLFVLSTHSPRSWDSRYFGPVPLAAVRARAIPIWRFKP